MEHIARFLKQAVQFFDLAKQLLVSRTKPREELCTRRRRETGGLVK